MFKPRQEFFLMLLCFRWHDSPGTPSDPARPLCYLMPAPLVSCTLVHPNLLLRRYPCRLRTQACCPEANHSELPPIRHKKTEYVTPDSAKFCFIKMRDLACLDLFFLGFLSEAGWAGSEGTNCCKVKFSSSESCSSCFSSFFFCGILDCSTGMAPKMKRPGLFLTLMWLVRSATTFICLPAWGMHMGKQEPHEE